MERVYRRSVDLGRLVDELLSAGVEASGTTDGQTVTLELADNTDPALVDNIVAAHDPTVPSLAQRNRQTMTDRATQALANLNAAAAALAAGTATAAQQRAALELCCRTCARLVRLVLDELDTAD